MTSAGTASKANVPQVTPIKLENTKTRVRSQSQRPLLLRGSYLRPWPIWGWRWLRCPWCCCTGTGRRLRSLPPCPRWPWPRRGRPWPCRRCRPPARWCCTSAHREESFRCKRGWCCGGDKLAWCAAAENICGCEPHSAPAAAPQRYATKPGQIMQVTKCLKLELTWRLNATLLQGHTMSSSLVCILVVWWHRILHFNGFNDSFLLMHLSSGLCSYNLVFLGFFCFF